MSKLGPYELNTAILGDCLEAMRQIPDNSVDSIITDPPYGLGNDPDILELLEHWLNDKDYDTGSGFMNKAWDVVPGPAVWRECFRVLKPGGCLMAFGGTRTCDLLSIAIRLAGFQRFDSLCWLHGQGFAKGIAIDKVIDQYFGKAGEREVIGRKSGERYKYAFSSDFNDESETSRLGSGDAATITAPATEAAALWSGYRSQLKPAHEVILCFWKPREKSFAFNALKWGVAGLNIDGGRIAVSEDDPDFRQSKAKNDLPFTEVEPGLKTIKDQHELSARHNKNGRYPANVLLSHHPACVRVGVKQVKSNERPNCEGKEYEAKRLTYGKYDDDTYKVRHADPDGLESVPDYRCHPDCAVLQLDRQAGERPVSGSAKNGRPAKGNNYDRNNTVYSPGLGSRQGRLHNDSGSASRFYYTPKAPPREKWFYCEICDDCYPYKERDNHAHGKPKGQRKHQIAHPTVKPIAICNFTLGVLEYLCRLTKTPTGGIVLDPFGGSGTTALAAIANGRDFLIIENDPIYHKIATKRIEQAMAKPRQLELIK